MTAVHKDIKQKKKNQKNLADNHVHNILRLFDGSANFPFNKSETKRDYL